ncbi:MAG: hypothetical protein GWN58_36510, partial [Anaerolineae bacterium]|nr:hypothetical protein [Anaerolineae bacterium]
LTMLTELCAIVAYTLWEDLFHQEGETIDELLRAGRKMKAIREAYAFLECGLGTTKALMDARQQALGI